MHNMAIGSVIVKWANTRRKSFHIGHIDFTLLR